MATSHFSGGNLFKQESARRTRRGYILLINLQWNLANENELSINWRKKEILRSSQGNWMRPPRNTLKCLRCVYLLDMRLLGNFLNNGLRFRSRWRRSNPCNAPLKPHYNHPQSHFISLTSSIQISLSLLIYCGCRNTKRHSLIWPSH
jgi:hypothetical protein